MSLINFLVIPIIFLRISRLGYDPRLCISSESFLASFMPFLSKSVSIITLEDYATAISAISNNFNPDPETLIKLPLIPRNFKASSSFFPR